MEPLEPLWSTMVVRVLVQDTAGLVIRMMSADGDEMHQWVCITAAEAGEVFDHWVNGLATADQHRRDGKTTER